MGYSQLGLGWRVGRSVRETRVRRRTWRSCRGSSGLESKCKIVLITNFTWTVQPFSSTISGLTPSDCALCMKRTFLALARYLQFSIRLMGKKRVTFPVTIIRIFACLFGANIWACPLWCRWAQSAPSSVGGLLTAPATTTWSTLIAMSDLEV